MACCDSIIQYRFKLTACTLASKSTADYWLTSSRRLLCAFLARSLKMASMEIQDVSDSNGKGENYQRTLTLLNEAVDILRSPCSSTDHPQQLPGYRSVGSVQVPATSERGELRETARLFPFYSQGASAGKISSRQPFEWFWPSAFSSGPKQSFIETKGTLDSHVHLPAWIRPLGSAFKRGESNFKRSRSRREKRITFDKYGGYQQLEISLLKEFPKLREGGGF